MNYTTDRNESFRVRVDNTQANSAKASVLLGECVERMLKLKKFLKRKYNIGSKEKPEEIDLLDDHHRLDIDKETYLRIYRFLKRFNENSFVENIPKHSKDDTSYNEEKGQKIAICLRDTNKNFHDINTIMFVVLHEMSHSITVSYGHDESFWYNFKWILEQAVECGIYTPVNYKKNPQHYCGIEITFNPFYDL